MTRRYEITRMDDEPDTWYCLDTERQRAHYLRIELCASGVRATAANTEPGHGTYRLLHIGGGWQCDCMAGLHGHTCYHRATVEAACEIMAPALRAARERESWRRIFSRPVRHSQQPKA